MRRKDAFLAAILGEDGARALAKAAERAQELAGAIYPRAVMSWVELVPNFDGELPGTNCRASFKKTEMGYDGYVTFDNYVHDFTGADLYHLAGAVAVAIEADGERVDPSLTPSLVSKLGRSIDTLMKSQLVRKELAKTSKNVKLRRQYEFAPGADKPTAYDQQELDKIGNERAAGARPRTPFNKDEIKPKAKNRIQLPGQTAKPNAPQAPTPPTLKQPKMKAPIPGAVATSPSKLATPTIPGTGAKAAGAAQMPAMPKPPKGSGATAKVVKSHAYTPCSICGVAQFKGVSFTGCRCFSALAKSVTVTETKTKTHLQLSFGSDWDQDAIDAMLAAVRK